MPELEYETYGIYVENLFDKIETHFSNEIKRPHGSFRILWTPAIGAIDYQHADPADKDLFDRHGWDVITYAWMQLRVVMYEDAKAQGPWSISQVHYEMLDEKEGRMARNVKFSFTHPQNPDNTLKEIPFMDLQNDMNAFPQDESALQQWKKDIISSVTE